MRHVWIVLLALSLSTVVYGQKSAAVRQLEQRPLDIQDIFPHLNPLFIQKTDDFLPANNLLAQYIQTVPPVSIYSPNKFFPVRKSSVY